MRKQMGFTLVEIAVVLVIIGLLLGGVLKGQELIAQAKIRNVANDFNGLTAAIYSYQDRYRALPGDDSRATSRWTQTGVKDGDGDGQVEGEYEASGVALDLFLPGPLPCLAWGRQPGHQPVDPNRRQGRRWRWPSGRRVRGVRRGARY